MKVRNERKIMKLIINYDFVEALKNVKEPYGVMKLVRNNKREWIKFDIPFTLLLEMPIMFRIGVIRTLTYMGIGFSIAKLIYGSLEYKNIGDIYAKKSINDLKHLAYLLREQYLNTDYELLLQSEYYDKKYKLKINEEKTVEILESKYILVPTYDFNNNIKNVSIEQEHRIGSKIYVLSLGSPEKRMEFARASI